MTWEAVGALGELVGAVAVVLTLIFLTLQIRQHTKAIHTEATYNATSAMQLFYLNLGGSDQASDIWFDGMTNPDSLSPHRRLQFFCQCHAALLGFQHAFLIEGRGTLDRHLNDALTTTLLNVKNQPGFHQFWEDRKAGFDQGFRELVEELMSSDTEAPGSSVYARQ